PQVPPAVPTRRASDRVLAVLQGDVVVEGDDEALLTGPTAGVDLQDDVGDLLAGHDGIVLRQRPPPLDVVEPHDVDDAAGLRVPRDRKSTRLDSSHVKI